MIQNVLQYKKPQVSLHKIIDLINNQVITNPINIHQTLTTYYSDLFNHPNNFSTLPYQWEKEYQPIENIQNEWYINLLSIITEEEVQSTIKYLPNNKASGPLQILFDIIKHLQTPL